MKPLFLALLFVGMANGAITLPSSEKEYGDEITYNWETIRFPKYYCKRHGDIHQAAYKIVIEGPPKVERIYCLYCLIEFMDKAVRQAKEIKDAK